MLLLFLYHLMEHNLFEYGGEFNQMVNTIELCS